MLRTSRKAYATIKRCSLFSARFSCFLYAWRFKYKFNLTVTGDTNKILWHKNSLPLEKSILLTYSRCATVWMRLVPSTIEGYSDGLRTHSQHFTEPEGWYHSHESMRPDCIPGEYVTQPQTYFTKLHFNTILSTSISPTLSLRSSLLVSFVLSPLFLSL
jgi:hypothetical protein